MRLLSPFVFLLLALAVLTGQAACGSGGPQGGTYIALGDSLSEGVGASDRRTTAFVPLVHAHLAPAFELVNLGHSGDTSQDLLDHGHLQRAVDEIEERRADADPDNDVALVTLEIGGNDLLGLFTSLVVTGVCVDLRRALTLERCVDPLETALQRFETNLDTALGRLRGADPELTIVLMTLYNPFSGTVPLADEAAELALEGDADTPFPEGLNDIVRARADASGALLAEVHPPFQGRAEELIAGDLIHPNDAGYRLIADAVIAALSDR